MAFAEARDYRILFVRGGTEPHASRSSRPDRRCVRALVQPSFTTVPGVPEGQQLQNRMCLTLAPRADGDQQGEIRRLEAMGATVIAVGEGEVDWVIMKDPKATSSACSARA
jgi:hypothetical protein